jgi:hypothetical protein
MREVTINGKTVKLETGAGTVRSVSTGTWG